MKVLFAYLFISIIPFFSFQNTILAKDLPYKRVVSIDYCADQYVLKFIDKQNIAAISYDADKDFSFMRDHAIGIKKIRANTEEILSANPDIVIKTYAGSRNLKKILDSLNIKLLTLPNPVNLKEIKEVLNIMREVSADDKKVNDVLKNIESYIKGFKKNNKNISAIYLSPAGMTAGAGTLIDNLFKVSGLINYQTKTGWTSLPLEKIINKKPNVIVYSSFKSLENHPDAWNPLRHPVIKTQLKSVPTINLKPSVTSCGGWFFLEALNILKMIGNV